METVVRHSDSKGRVILPSDFAQSTLLIERVSDTELRIRKGKTVPRRKYSFAKLVAGITDENRHAEVQTGSPVGKELL
jgi:antitoxin component of MazEF toxin-antitoxin module